LPVGKRQLQRKLKEHTNGGQRYKCALIKKTLSAKNRREREAYGREHVDKSMEDFWSYIFFSDEAHIDPTSLAVEDVLRERGTRYDTENIQERGEKKGIKFHVAAWITWYRKQRNSNSIMMKKTMYNNTTTCNASKTSSTSYD
jgi:hypothetical protein